MAEEKVNSMENKDIGKVKIPTIAEVTKAETMRVGEIPHVDDAQPYRKYYEATDTLRNGDETYTVTANQTIDKLDPKVTIINEYVEDKNIGKDATTSNKKTINQKLTDDGYEFKSSESFRYENNKELRELRQTETYNTDAWKQSHGYTSLKEKTSKETISTRDSSGRETVYEEHSTDIMASGSIIKKRDIKNIMHNDASAKVSYEAYLHKGMANPGVHITLIEGQNMTFSADMNPSGDVHYSTALDEETGIDIYHYADGTLKGETKDKETGKVKRLPDEVVRNQLQKNQQQAQKILQELTKNGKIETLADYYNYVPDVASVKWQSLTEAIDNRNFRQGADYEVSSAQMQIDNKQRIAESMMRSPENVVATMLQQKKQNSL